MTIKLPITFTTDDILYSAASATEQNILLSVMTPVGDVFGYEGFGSRLHEVLINLKKANKLEAGKSYILKAIENLNIVIHSVTYGSIIGIDSKVRYYIKYTDKLTSDLKELNIEI